MASTVKPTPIALVVCDNIYTEPGGKTALVGLFGGISAATFPVRSERWYHPLSSYIFLINTHNTAKLEIVHAETDKVVVSAQGPFPDKITPITVVDMNFIFNNVVFPEEGTYYIRFWANDHILVMRPFEVQKIKPSGANK